MTSSSVSELNHAPWKRKDLKQYECPKQAQHWKVEKWKKILTSQTHIFRSLDL